MWPTAALRGHRPLQNGIIEMKMMVVMLVENFGQQETDFDLNEIELKTVTEMVVRLVTTTKAIAINFGQPHRYCKELNGLVNFGGSPGTGMKFRTVFLIFQHNSFLNNQRLVL